MSETGGGRGSVGKYHVTLTGDTHSNLHKNTGQTIYQNVNDKKLVE